MTIASENEVRSSAESLARLRKAMNGVLFGQERLIDEWVPALIWSPSNGEHTLTVELLDPKGEPMQARWNPVVRKFTVSGDNP